MNDNKNKLLKKTIQQFDKKHYELIHKIRNIGILTNDDIIYIQTLPNEQILDIINTYNEILNTITDFLEKSY